MSLHRRLFLAAGAAVAAPAVWSSRPVAVEPLAITMKVGVAVSLEEMVATGVAMLTWATTLLGTALVSQLVPIFQSVLVVPFQVAAVVVPAPVIIIPTMAQGSGSHGDAVECLPAASLSNREILGFMEVFGTRV